MKAISDVKFSKIIRRCLRTSNIFSGVDQITYYKLTGFGSYAYTDFCNMMLFSRSGESMFVTISAMDTGAPKVHCARMFAQHKKISAVYYSNSEKALYVKLGTWAGNLGAKVLASSTNNYAVDITRVDGLPDGCVEVPIASIEEGIRTIGFATDINKPSYTTNFVVSSAKMAAVTVENNPYSYTIMIDLDYLRDSEAKNKYTVEYWTPGNVVFASITDDGRLELEFEDPDDYEFISSVHCYY